MNRPTPLTYPTGIQQTGSAPETTLDALCQLLRALLLRFPDGVLGLLQPVVAAAAAPPSDAGAAALAQVGIE